MFNTHSESCIRPAEGLTYTRNTHVDVRLNINLLKGKFSRASAVYSKYVPLGLILKEINKYKDYETDPCFAGIGLVYRYTGEELFRPMNDEQYWVTNEVTAYVN